MALATILMRPIVIINGRPVQSFKQTVLPVNVAKSFWQEKIVLAHHYPVHFDATEVVEASPDLGPCQTCQEFGHESCPTHNSYQ